MRNALVLLALVIAGCDASPLVSLAPPVTPPGSRVHGAPPVTKTPAAPSAPTPVPSTTRAPSRVVNIGPPSITSGQCGVVVDGLGYIYSEAQRDDGSVALATESGLYVEDAPRATTFSLVDDNWAWRVVNAHGSLLTLQYDETIARYDAVLAKSSLFSGDDHLIDIDYDAAADTVVFTQEVPGQLETLNAGATRALASSDVAHDFVIAGDDVFYSDDINLVRVPLAGGDPEIVFDDFGFSPQRLFFDDGYIYMTTGYGGGVERVSVADHSVDVVEPLTSAFWTVDVAVHGAWAYFSERDFDAFNGAGRITRAPKDGSAAPTTVADCVIGPDLMLIHDGVIDVGQDGDENGNGAALVRITEPR